MDISRVIISVPPFRALTTLLITCLLRPLPLQVDFEHGRAWDDKYVAPCDLLEYVVFVEPSEPS